MTAVHGVSATIPHDQAAAISPTALPEAAFSNAIQQQLIAQTNDNAVPEEPTPRDGDPLGRRGESRFQLHPRRPQDFLELLKLQMSAPEVLFHANTAVTINDQVALHLQHGAPPPQLINLMLKSTKDVNDASSPGFVDKNLLVPAKAMIHQAVLQTFAEIKEELRQQGDPQVDQYRIDLLQIDKTDDEFRTLRYVTNLPKQYHERLFQEARQGFEPQATQMLAGLEQQIEQSKAGEQLQEGSSQQLMLKLQEAIRELRAGETPTRARQRQSNPEAEFANVQANFINEARVFLGLAPGADLMTTQSGPLVTEPLQTPGDALALIWASEHGFDNWGQVKKYALDARALVKGFIDTASNIPLRNDANQFLPEGYQATHAELVLSIDGISHKLSEELDGQTTLGINLGVELRKKRISEEAQTFVTKVRVHGKNTDGLVTFKEVDAKQYNVDQQYVPITNPLELSRLFEATTRVASHTDMLNPITRERIDAIQQQFADSGQTLYDKLAYLQSLSRQLDQSGDELSIPLTEADQQFIESNALVPPRLGGQTEQIFWTRYRMLHQVPGIKSMAVANIDLKDIGALNVSHQARTLVHDVNDGQTGREMAEILATGQDAVTEMKSKFFEIYKQTATEVLEHTISRFREGAEPKKFYQALLDDLKQNGPVVRMGGDEIVFALAGNRTFLPELFQIMEITMQRAKAEGIEARISLIVTEYGNYDDERDIAAEFQNTTISELQGELQGLLNYSDNMLNQGVKPHEKNVTLLENIIQTIPPHLRPDDLTAPIPNAIFPESPTYPDGKGQLVPTLIPVIYSEGAMQFYDLQGGGARLSEMKTAVEGRLEFAAGVLAQVLTGGTGTDSGQDVGADASDESGPVTDSLTQTPSDQESGIVDQQKPGGAEGGQLFDTTDRSTSGDYNRNPSGIKPQEKGPGLINQTVNASPQDTKPFDQASLETGTLQQPDQKPAMPEIRPSTIVVGSQPVEETKPSTENAVLQSAFNRLHLDVRGDMTFEAYAGFPEGIRKQLEQASAEFHARQAQRNATLAQTDALKVQNATTVNGIQQSKQVTAALNQQTADIHQQIKSLKTQITNNEAARRANLSVLEQQLKSASTVSGSATGKSDGEVNKIVSRISGEVEAGQVVTGTFNLNAAEIPMISLIGKQGEVANSYTQADSIPKYMLRNTESGVQLHAVIEKPNNELAFVKVTGINIPANAKLTHYSHSAKAWVNLPQLSASELNFINSQIQTAQQTPIIPTAPVNGVNGTPGAPVSVPAVPVP